MTKDKSDILEDVTQAELSSEESINQDATAIYQEVESHASEESLDDGQIEATAHNQRTDNLAGQIMQLEKALAGTKAQAKESYDAMLMARAEVENIRKRATKDVANAHKYGSENMAKELLNVVDSLESGLQSCDDLNDPKQKAIHEGLELTYKMFIDTLLKFGITQVDPTGQAFDPKLHEALTMQPSAEVEPNQVLQVIQKGYIIHERVLRPARVIVSKAI